MPIEITETGETLDGLWILVPKEPTPEMIVAARLIPATPLWDQSTLYLWQAMLAAAPKAAETQEDIDRRLGWLDDETKKPADPEGPAGVKQGR